MTMPILAPALSRELAVLAQGLGYDERVQLLAALEDIASAANGQVVTSLDDPAVPAQAREFIENLRPGVSSPA